MSQTVSTVLNSVISNSVVINSNSTTNTALSRSSQDEIVIHKNASVFSANVKDIQSCKIMDNKKDQSYKKKIKEEVQPLTTSNEKKDMKVLVDELFKKKKRAIKKKSSGLKLNEKLIIQESINTNRSSNNDNNRSNEEINNESNNNDIKQEKIDELFSFFNQKEIKKTKTKTKKVKVIKNMSNEELKDYKITCFNSYKKKNNIDKYNLETSCFKLDIIKHITELKNEDIKLFSRDYFQGSKFFMASSYKQIFDIINKNLNTINDLNKLNKLNNYYENYEKNDKVKLFVDIDFELKNRITSSQFDEFTEIMIKLVTNYINNYLDKTYNIKNPEILILRSNNYSSKISIHIIYQNVIFNDIYNIKYFFEELKYSDYFNHHIHSLIDMNVYKVGCFRCIFNTKYDKNNMMNYHKFINYEYNFDDNEEIKYDLFLKTLVCNVNKNIEPIIVKLIHIPNVIKRCLLKKNFDKIDRVYDYIYEINDGFLKIIETCLSELNSDFCNEYDYWLVITSCINDLYYHIDDIYQTKLYDIYTKWCEKSAKYDENNNHNIFHRIKSPIDINYILSITSKDFRLSPIYNYNKISFNIDKYNNIKDEISDLKDMKEEDFNKLNDHEIIAIKSKPGTGKTTFLNKFLPKYFDKPILSIVSRTNLSYGHSDSMPYLINYKDSEAKDFKIYDSYTAKQKNKLVVQLESIINFDHKYFKDGIIILDEVNSLLNHFRSTTLSGKRKLIFRQFIEILRNANKILLLDADLTDWNLNFIFSITKNKNHIVYQNSYKNRVGIDAIFYNKSITLLNKLFDSLKENKFFICCFDSMTYLNTVAKNLKTYCEEFNLMYEGKPLYDYFLIYTSKLGSNQIDTELWKNKFVLYSPKIIYGISFVYEFKTDVFCFITKSTLNALSINQQIQRCRNQSSVHIFCRNYYTYLKYKSITDVEEELQSMINYNILVNDEVNELNNNIIDNNTEDLSGYYNSIYTHTLYYDTMLKTNIKKYLICFLEEAGYNVIFDNTIDEYVNDKKVNDVLLDVNNNEDFDVINNENVIRYNIIKNKTTNKVKEEEILNDNSQFNVNVLERRVKIIEYLKLDYDNLTEFEKELVDNDKLLNSHINLKYLLINSSRKLDIKLFQVELDEFNIEKPQNKYNKINTARLLMKILEINKLEDINNDIYNNYHKKIDNEELIKYLPLIKKQFRITNTTNDFNVDYGYYELFLIFKTILTQLYDKLFVKNNNKVDYKYFKVDGINKKFYTFKIDIELINKHKKYFITDDNKDLFIDDI